MRAKYPLHMIAVLVLTLCASDLLAQKEFDEAHAKIASFWSETSNPKKDTAQKAKVLKDFDALSGQLRPLIDAGTLSYLNSSHAISSDELTIKIAQALAYPYMSVDTLADTNGNVSIVSVPHQNAYAIAYDIATCASCSTSWIKIAARRDGHWVFTAHLDNPVTDNAVHLGWVGSKANPLLVLYGVHWGDAHNRLDVHLYSIENGIKEVWSSLNLSQGEIAIQENRMTLKYWTNPARPYREKQQVFEVEDRQVTLLQTKFAEIQ